MNSRRPHAGSASVQNWEKHREVEETTGKAAGAFTGHMGNGQIKRRISLAAKFSLVSIALILVTSVGISLFMVRLELNSYYQELLNHGMTVADTTAQNCELGIYTEDRQALRAVIQGLSKDTDIIYAAVLNSSGMVLASKVFQPEFDIPETPFMDGRNAGKVSLKDFMNARDGKQYLEIVHPVMTSSGGISDALLSEGRRQEPRVIGFLRLGLTQEGLQKRISQLLVSTTIFTSLLVVLGSLLSLYLSRRITQPLGRLKAIAEEIAKGNFETPIEIRTTDEIADLARTFDYMRGRVQEFNEQLQHDALHDALTGLPNRALFIDRLKYAITLATLRKGYYYGVLFIDLDGFKVINDSLGHTVGDLLLIAFSKKLRACIRPTDTVARLGGDEFAVLLEDISGEGNALYVASRIKEELKQPFAVSGNEVFMTGSMGIALSSSGYEAPEQVIRDADTAMYQSKAHRRADVTIFEPAMHARAMERLMLETDLRRAIERREFVAYYQPILSVKGRRIVGYEALARWHHPERGLVPPGQFILMAEETGMVVAIDRLILRQACEQMKTWLDRFRGNHLNFVSVNLAHKQVLQPDLVEHVAQVLKETALPPEHLKLEITENVLFENPETASTLLMRLRGLGVQLYIDDFGTGYSSLSYLHRLPINGLKIDRSFVKRIDDVGENQAIIRTIMTLARDLNIDAVAEGVETASQLAHLESLNCGYWQGFFFSKPVRSEEAQALIAA